MTLHLFEAFGVELEYMIVEQNNLKVLPIADEVLKNFAGIFTGEIDNGKISWSNELVLHVIELKTNGPASHLDKLSQLFSENIKQINKILKPLGGMLLPSAMHPLMDPYTEMKLWPHEYNEIYDKYNSIFDCRGHGWANLQSTHLNLPFCGDEEFGRLHAAIRLILPILPALSASSPIKDGKYSGFKDTRLKEYQSNQQKVPSIAGKIIPEQVYTQKDYRTQILEKSFGDIAPYDPERILQDEWLNSRGAIARFQRNAIEIRLLDIQECPKVDLAVIKLIVSVIQQLTNEKWSNWKEQKKWEIAPLYEILQNCIQNGEKAIIDNPLYLKVFGYKGKSADAGTLWQFLSQQSSDLSESDREIIELIGEEGTLSTRIIKRLGEHPTSKEIIDVYKELSMCLMENKFFKINR